MRPTECPREQDVMDAIASGRWPHRCDAELHAHVEACDLCSDLAEVVVPIRDDFEQTLYEARVPTAGATWWRAQVRARLEAREAASRPMRAVTAVALACSTGLLAAVLTLAWPWMRTWLWAQGVDAPALPDPSGVIALLAGRGLPLAIGAALIALAAPVALILALSERRR
jgi:hypothetical protein